MRRVRRKGGNKEKVFGCDLMEHLTTTGQDIPQVLRSCSQFIEEHGIVDGIYRLSGVSSNIQKLRSEFDSEGNPDLTKDVYHQDIHCVSSLCKAYFRELPNPLLTYQLYDRFAEAVAVQLEDERLVKIQEVLRSLPLPHFRTLEFLMRHLITMSGYSSETNMHSRNLAIVWAPNLLRSKDIEASGFNGTAAFMEVRVQSIVVEFILTHVPQLFPNEALVVPNERRKSLPSPTVLPNQENTFFRAMPFQYPGNMSPGDGPPAMRPYHAIIEPSDKRKGSLKGRKWRSIFNLGGRLPDPRKRNKGSTKEKEKQTLRPAKSMDSLSPGPFDGNRQGASPTQLSPVSPLGQEGGSSGGGGGLAANSYAVTYRRGGGASVSVVSGGGGTQGTYNRLESVSGASGGGEGAGPAAAAAVTGLVAGGALAPVTRSPGQASRAEKRAGIHISGPFSVTVPLHITSGLLGVIQGSQGDEETPASAQEEGERRRRGKGEEEEEKREEEEEKERARKEDRKREEEEKEEEQIKERTTESGSGMGGEREEEVEEEREIHTQRVEVTPPAMDGEGEERSLNGQLSSEEEEEEEEEEEDLIEEEEEEAAGEAEEECETGEGDYMEMRATLLVPPASAEGTPVGTPVVGSSVDADVPMSVEEESPDADLPLDFADTFGFLDTMMESGISQPNNEFSVEPPCENEYEDSSWDPHDDQTSTSTPQKAQPSPASPVPLRTPTSRPMSLPPHTRLPSKSHSLPYKCSPSYPNASSSSDEDEDEVVLSGLSDEDEDEDDDERGEYEDMFVRSLPNELEFHGLASRREPLPANSSEDTCLSGQSEDRVLTDFILSSGYVNMSTGGPSHNSSQTDTSSSVSGGQSEGTIIHNEVPLPISSQNINDIDQLQSSPVTDTGLQANQFMDILPLSQSECLEVQTDSSHVYEMMRVTDVESNGATNKEMDKETHGEKSKEEEMGEEKMSCQEGQGVDESWVTHTATAGLDAHTQLDQDSAIAHPGPPLPPRDHRNNQQTDSNGCHGGRASDSEVEEVDRSDLHPAPTTAAPSQGETRTCAGEGPAPESDTSFNVVSHEPTGEGWQDGTYQKEEEEGEEMEEEKDGVNEGKIETGDADEEESDREGGGQEERVTDEEVEEDGEGEKDGEQRVGSNEGEWTEREEKDEGKRPPVQDEEEDQPDGSEQVVTDQKDPAEETADQRSIGEEKEEKEENETERGENDYFTSMGESGAVSGQVGKEREEVEEVEEGHTEEGYLEPVGHQVAEQLLESQTDHGASEGAEKSELLREEREGEEEEEQGENSISETEQGGERNVGEERKDRESEADDKLASLGQGVGRTLVVSKQAPVRTHQAKAVPVVPPKPQQSRLTALGLRQQMQSRDTHSPQPRDRDAPHSQHTHNQDTKRPPQDMQHTPDMQTTDTQTPDTETLNTLHEDIQHQAQARHTESPVAQEHTDAALHTGDTTQPCGPENEPTTEHRDTDPHLPHITINQQHPQMETPEQALDTRAEQHAAHRQSETEVGTSGDEGGTKEQGAEGKDAQGEQRDAEAERWRGPPPHSETDTGRDASPDVKKDKLSLREGDRERRTRDREVKRNSGISICFDEAVARATREREREREHSEREKERERGVSVQEEKAKL